MYNRTELKVYALDFYHFLIFYNLNMLIWRNNVQIGLIFSSLSGSCNDEVFLRTLRASASFGHSIMMCLLDRLNFHLSQI